MSRFIRQKPIRQE